MMREKGPMLRATGMLLGAICVLLLAGGMPGGGGSAGHRMRMVMGVIFLFFAVAGIGVMAHCGVESLRWAHMGGGMWFGAVGMGCLAIVGALFSAIFGYLAHLSLRVEKLWVAVAHLSVVLVVVGAFTDAYAEQRFTLTRHVGEPSVVHDKMRGESLPFSVEVKDMQVERYEGSDTYTLLEHRNGRWLPVAEAKREGAAIRCGQEEWSMAELRALPGGEGRYLALPGSPMRVLVQQPGPVKEYRAVCRLSAARGESEARECTLRVNDPASWGDWRIYLMSCSADGRQVQLMLRRAPGRPLVFTGLVGVFLCCFAWAFGNKRSTQA